MMKSIAAAIVMLCCWGGTVQAATGVLFDSDSGDYIGAGRKIVFDSSSTITSDKSTSTHIAISVGNGNDSFTLDFSAPRGTSFTSTGSLAGATRYPFNSPQRPGLSVSGDGRGCNQLSGWFQITEVVFATSGQLARLSLDFKQNCENGSSALYGAVRINTDAPLAIPPLKAIAGVAQSAYPNDTIALDGSSSFSRPSSALSYSWTQVSGQHVDITGQNSSLVTFTTPLELAGGENLVFQLLTTTAAGTTDADRISVHVASRNDPQTYVQLVSDSGDYIGGGSTTRLTPADGDLSFASNNRSGVTATYNGSDFYSLQFGPASSTPFTVGAYENAQRFAFADKSAPGMDVNGAGRGCNTITGRFDLLDIVTTANGPSRVALNFEQHCEGATPALRGQVRYNYIAKGVPIADAGADSTVMPGDNVILDGTASHDDVGITSYQWTQVSGPTVLLQGDKTSRASFAAPTVNPPQTLEFRLLVGDADDLAAADRKVVTVSTSPPPVTPPPSTTPVPSTPTSSGGGGGGAMSPSMAAIFIFFAGASRRRRFLPR